MKMKTNNREEFTVFIFKLKSAICYSDTAFKQLKA